MFPIKSGDAYIKENGERSTLGAMINEGGSSDLPEYGVGDAGKVLAVDNEGDLQWKTPAGSELPEYGVGDAGNFLGVDNEGLLEWKTLPAGTKIYYKDYSPNFGTDEALAKFSDGAASASSFHMAIPELSSSSVGINGYTPISALAYDVFSGHAVGILLKYYTYGGLPVYYLSLAIADTAIGSNSVRARVFYVKNNDIERLT